MQSLRLVSSCEKVHRIFYRKQNQKEETDLKKVDIIKYFTLRANLSLFTQNWNLHAKDKN